MRKVIIGSLLLVAMFLSGANARLLWAQAEAGAQVKGTITDPSGATVPGAKITATQTEKGMPRMTVSGSDGSYLFPNLPVGPYKLEVEAAGFQTYTQTGILLQVSDNPTINVALQVGRTSQQINVTANATMAQTQATSVSQVINQRNIVDLPLNGRNLTQLILLSGAATDTGAANSDVLYSADLVTSKNYPSSTAISVAGGQSNGANYLMDGGDNNDNFTNVNLPFPFPDAVQEFSVETNSLSARYGLHPGAVVNVVTKSGSNKIHGDAFEFLRNGYTNARDYFASEPDPLKRNQFGGTFGGALLKERLFGFFGYQGTRTRTAPGSSVAFLPTAAALNGDFSTLESAACRTGGALSLTNPATGLPFAGNLVSTSLFNGPALKLAKDLPVPSDPCGRYTYAVRSTPGENQFLGRMDWTQNSKHTVFGRYFIADYKAAPPSFANNLLNTNSRGLIDRSQSMVLGDTYSFTPTTLNSTHLTWTRMYIRRGAPPDFINYDSVGVQDLHSSFPNFLDLRVNGHFAGGCGTCAPAVFPRNGAQVADDLDIIHGRHHISIGGDVIRNEYNQSSASAANGVFTFSGSATGDSLVDFLLGDPSTFNQSGAAILAYRQTYLGFYGTDNIRISSHINLEAGLRWEPYLPTRETAKQGQFHFFQNDFTAGTKSSLFTNAPAGLFFTGEHGVPNGLSDTKLGDFAPRVGLVWDPKGDGKTTIRAGAGIFYDNPLMFYMQDGASASPWIGSVGIANPVGGFTNPYLGYPGGNPFPLVNPPPKTAEFLPDSQYLNYTIEGRPTYMEQWDLSLQRQITANWLISATYIGNKTTHVWTSENTNPAKFIPGTCGEAPCSTSSNIEQRRLLYLQDPVKGAMYSEIDQLDNGSNAEYNGVLLTTQHRFSKNYSALANYTYSHCISEGDFQGDMYGSSVQNNFNRNADRGSCGFDLRHNFNLSFITISPSSSNRWVSRLAGGWELAPIVSLHTGTWFSVWDGSDQSMTGGGVYGPYLDRPNLVGNPYVRNTSTRQWITPSAFALSTLGTYGNLGSDTLLGPGHFNIDMAVSRNFKIKEDHAIELRFEFFNVANHANFGHPDTTLADSSFGTINGDGGPRILQFAMKYKF